MESTRARVSELESSSNAPEVVADGNNPLSKHVAANHVCYPLLAAASMLSMLGFEVRVPVLLGVL